jgi:SSS family solute:Na+ symporter
MIQRNLGARTVWDAKFGNVLAGIPKTIGAYIFILPLTLAPLYFAMKGIFVPRPDEAYGLLILNLLPSGMLGLAIAGLFAAGLSTMDSMLNSTSTLFVRDVYERFLVRNKSDAHYFKVARWVTLFGLVICIGLTPFIMKIPLIMQMEKTLMALFEGPLVAILALGIFWRRVNGVGALSALVGGCAANLIMNSFTSMQFLAIEAAGAGIGVVLLVAISLLTGKPDSEQIEGLTWGPGIEYKFEQDLKRLNGLDGKKANTSGWKKRVGRIPFYRDMRVWATIMLLVQIILLLYYSSG